MQNFFRLGLFSGLLLLGACSSHQVITDNVIKQLQNDNIEEKTLQKLEVAESSNDYLLFTQELSRVYFINNDIDKSLAYGKKSTDYYNKVDQQAILNATSVSGTLLASTFGSDNNITYTGSDYERALDYFYSSLNYLKKNDINSALIDIRAAADIQKLSAVKREARIAKAQKEVSSKNNYTLSADTKKVIDENARIIADSQNSFLNAYIYYLSGNIRELSGDFGGALVDYKLALNVNPNNPYVISDSLRLAKNIDSSYYQTLKQSNIKETTNYNKKATVIVVYEQGFIPAKEQIKGTTWLPNGSFYTIALPVYHKSEIKPSRVLINLFTNSGESQSAKMEVIADLYKLAQNDLAEKYPFIVARQVSRAVSKGAMQAVGQNQMDDNAGLGLLMYGVGSISSVLETADTRSFRVLPHFVQVAKLDSTSSINKIQISVNSNRNLEISDIFVNVGETAIVYVIDTNNYIYAKVIYQSKKV
ncbi:MAG: hypothetical protein LBH40_05445 [Alphaproteobacteria bacterium]|jgi:hypothetical protein|nr:hypothetical protein [Alphaproteobacteria bacterium]